jgi:vacuolar-type H+-ATPase subunit F/Vma7
MTAVRGKPPVARRLVVVTTTELAPGYRLAGVATIAPESADDAEARLRELIDVQGEQGIIAVHEPFLEALDPAWRRRLDAGTSPLVVALPAGEAGVGESARRERLLRMLWQAVGYQITFEPGDRS